MTTPDHPVAIGAGDGRLSAPAAARNMAPIQACLARHLPERGRVLEIASGTGQHCVAYARAFPDLIWQPSDVDPERLHSIRAWQKEEALGNLLPPLQLDATAPWPKQDVAPDVILIINLLHLLSSSAAKAVLRSAAQALGKRGSVFIYGPFRTGGAFRSVGDKRFHKLLIDQDPAIGYKDLEWVTEIFHSAGLGSSTIYEMPANNLAIVAGR